MEIVQNDFLQYGFLSIAITLVFYVLKTTEKREIKSQERETKYQEIIQKDIKCVCEDVKEIKGIVEKCNK